MARGERERENTGTMTRSEPIRAGLGIASVMRGGVGGGGGDERETRNGETKEGAGCEGPEGGGVGRAGEGEEEGRGLGLMCGCCLP